jgi:hypothetical protein
MTWASGHWREVLLLGLLIAPGFVALSGITTLRFSPPTVPNEATRAAVRNGLVVAAVGVLVLVPDCYVLGRVTGIVGPVSFALSVGGVGALLLGLAGGLAPALRHFTVRGLLWWYGMAPWDLVGWLGRLHRQRLMHWSIGGYVFVHALVADFFATGGTPVPAGSTELPGRPGANSQEQS